MTPSSVRSFEDEQLTRYLLGMLPEAETERLDELSVADDDFAARLTAAEHELVDAYVSGALSGSRRTQFESQYLSSPLGREKVEFARALAAASCSAVPPAVPRRALDLRWALAAAAVILVAAGLLVRENLRLRRELADVRATSAALEQRAEQVLAQLNAERQAGADAAREVAQLRDALASLERRTTDSPQPVVAIVTLRPATRGPGGTTDVALAGGTTAVRFDLPLEGGDFARYEVTVLDAASGARVWQGRQSGPAGSGRRVLSVTVPAGALRVGQYVLELASVPPTGPAEPLNSYPFRIVSR